MAKKNRKSKDIVCQKNDELEVDIIDMGTEGEGIGKVKGYLLFVKDAVICDRVRVVVMKTKKNYGYARLLKIVKASPFRVEPKCPVARQCGGCQLQHCSYEKQTEWKEQKVKNCLERIGGFSLEGSTIEVEPILRMDEPYHYRNKAQFPVGTDKEGNPVAGFYAGRSHSIIANTDCNIQHPCNKEIVDTVLQFMKDYGILAYNEGTHTGLVRHILTRVGAVTGEVMICLVINGKKMPHDKELVDRLLNCSWNNKTAVNATIATNLASNTTTTTVANNETAVNATVATNLASNTTTTTVTNNKTAINATPAANIEDDTNTTLAIKSICLNYNEEKTNVILGQDIQVLYGEKYIEDYIGDIKYRISPLSFYQVNPVQTRRLYQTALEYADLKGGEVVWDLYCGIGTISLFLAQKAAHVCGVEIVPQAVEDAKENARLNHFENAEFFVGAAEDVVTKQYQKSNGSLKADVVTLDPPRKGCDEKLLETVIAMEPKRIVYVSCDPATLARDLRFLCDRGYELKKVRPCDMFGHSYHVETVCLLSRKDK